MASDEDRTGETVGSEKSHTKLLAVLALCSFFVGMDLSVVIPLAPTIAESTGAPVHLSQLLISAYAFGYILTAPIFGAVSDIWGRKKTIFSGMLILAIGTFLTGIGTNLSVLLVLRALTGVGAGMLQPGVYALIGDTFSSKRVGEAIGISTGALLSSSLIGPPLFGYMAVLTTWRWGFWIVAVGATVMLVVIYTLIPTDQPVNDIAPFTAISDQFRTAVSNPAVLFGLLAVFLFFGGSEGVVANYGIFFDLTYGLNAGRIGLLLLLTGGVSALCSPVGGRIADRVGKKITIIAAGVLGGVGILGWMMSTQNIVIAVGMVVLWAAGFGAGQTTLTALLSELDPNVRGTVLALQSSAMYAGSFTLTTGSAALLAWGDFLLVGIVCGGAMLVALPVMWYRIDEYVTGESVTEPSTQTVDMD